MLQRKLLLLAICACLDAIELPDAVTNLTAVQEGFDGMISVSWEHPFGFPKSFWDFYNISVSDNGHPVAFERDSMKKTNLTTITLEGPAVGVAYKLVVTPVRVDGAGMDYPEFAGPSTTTMLTFQAADTALMTPTNFQYGKNGLNEGVRVVWKWQDNGAIENGDNVWFFVRTCPKSQPDYCRHHIRFAKTITETYLEARESYTMEIFAHVASPGNTVPVRSSMAISGEIEVIPWDWPKPEIDDIVAEPEKATPYHSSYVVSWTISPHDRLIGITAAAYEAHLGLNFPVEKESTDIHGANISLALDYNTRYLVRCHATYDAGLGQTDMSYGEFVPLYTVQGPSQPVDLFSAKQIDFSDRVSLRWKPPRKTNGNLTYYHIRVTTAEGTDDQPIWDVDATVTNITVTIANVRFGSPYVFTITPVNVISEGHVIFGMAYKTEVILMARNNIRLWVIISSGLAVLALIGTYFAVQMS